MSVITTIGTKCKRCYGCIRNCPAKAIKVQNGQAQVVEELCIACGTCLKQCRQGAKVMEEGLSTAKELLQRAARVALTLAPSFVAAFPGVHPWQAVSAFRELGFGPVVEVAYGAELVAGAYVELLAQDPQPPVIATACPVVVNLVEIHFPELLPNLAPVVSPMIALGRYLKEREPWLSVVFAGPCVAKKDEMKRPSLRGAVDAVLTFGELQELLDCAGIDMAASAPAKPDPPHPWLARVFPVSGGLLKVAGVAPDVLRTDVACVEGPERCLQKLRALSGGNGHARIVDMLFCEGCIDGPGMAGGLALPERRQLVVDYTRQFRITTPTAPDGRASTGRRFSDRRPLLPSAGDEQLRELLGLHYDFGPEDEIDCGACGYPTCREKALALYRGLAEPDMCLPYLLRRADHRLADSAEQLVQMRQELIQSEKMAALGQFSAGIAHEINNPLGAILLLSASLLEEIDEDHPSYAELKTIVKETERCRAIVADLLDFARQSRLRREVTDVNALVAEVVEVVTLTRPLDPVMVRLDLDPQLPRVSLDAPRMGQVIRNLVNNAIDAMPGGGVLTLTTRRNDRTREVVIDVHDTGTGISRADLSRLFSPFFTTKPMGRGTGLGLATALGIVRMHGGDIRVASELGKGTQFSIRIPLVQHQTNPGEREANAHAQGQDPDHRRRQ